MKYQLCIYIFFFFQDVYRIGTLMELVRELALSFADDGKRVKVSSISCIIFRTSLNLLKFS